MHVYRILLAGLCFASFTFSGCKTSKSAKSNEATDVIIDSLQELIIDGSERPYQESSTRLNDIIHTRLEVKFDWVKMQMMGIATIEVKPYFHSTNNLELDAKGMNIQEVALVSTNGKTPLSFTYDSLKLKVKLDRQYTRNESYKIFVKYVAKPEELKSGGSDAISSDKGLYFINPLGKEKNKPVQLWTQGETEAASCWFPTIDRPNERMTQEILITVDSSYVTLSNGTFQYSTENGDGTRTDSWKQSLPAAPYLSMMAVGKWKVVKDKWRDKEVNYYMEPEFAPYTKQIFGRTPDMIEFYSKKLGVDYPWEKYSQVIVRDYVSGAMENTTATIHGDFFNQTDREMLDGDNESTVAHELFHQWFGDYVTCESWSNLPLNESFATYGEYLWLEHAYGRDEADYHGNQDLRRYLAESGQKIENLIRFQYDDKEDMFDMHSYAKGGRVLNMLRRYLGDDAFFEGLKTYLTENKLQSVEIHNLRLAMEKVSGEDLNWFFNQWFLAKGHPEVDIETAYDSLNSQVSITLTQKQDRNICPTYKLPLDIDIYYSNNKERQRIWFTKRQETVILKIKERPLLVNIDAEKQLLGVKTMQKSKTAWMTMLERAPLYMDRYEAINELAPYLEEKEVAELIKKAVKDKHYGIRNLAIKTLNIKAFRDQEEHKAMLINVIKSDPKSQVRAAALRKFNEYASLQTMPFLKEIATTDRSYMVIGEALNSINTVDAKEGLSLARQLAKDAKGSLLLNAAIILSEKGDSTDAKFFINGFNSITENNSKYAFTTLIGKYLSNQNSSTIFANLGQLENIARNESAWYIRMAAIQGLNEISLKIQTKISDIKNAAAKSPADAALVDRLDADQKRIDTLLTDIKSKETDAKVKRMIGQ